MAKEEATLLLKIKSVGEAILKRFRITLTDITNVVKGTVNGLKNLTVGMIDLARQSAKAQEVQQSFRALAQSQGQDAKMMLDNMRELSAGTISDLELMKQANAALLLGLPVERFGDMLKIARSSAKATGESMEFMLKSIVTGLGRGSKLILDNLGIVIDTNKAYEDYARTLGKTADALTDAEKKTAFINAALKAGKDNADAMGLSGLSLSDKYDRVKAAFENLTIQLGEKLIPAAGKFLEIGNKLIQVASNLLGATGKEGLKNEMAELVLKLNELEARSQRYAKSGAKELAKAEDILIAKTKSRIQEIEQELGAMAKQDQARIAQGEKRREILAQEEQDRITSDLNKAAQDEITKIEAQEREAEFQQAMKDAQSQHDFDMLQMQIDNDTARLLQQAKTAKQAELIVKKQDAKTRKLQTARADFEKQKDKEKLQNTQSTLGTIASLQTSHNKTLAGIGKAAAIADITISTAQGVARAWKLGPILGPILAPLVIAAGAAQIAKVAGVQLAEGGIVQARPGGTLATIGEGGQDEAVIPLEDVGGSAFGTTINITVNGGLLGDEAEARNFALAVDRELLNLRRANESASFDQDFT